MIDLKSSIQVKGKTVTQIITFLGGYKKTFEGIDSLSIRQGEFCHFNTKDGRHVMINTKNVLCVEVFSE